MCRKPRQDVCRTVVRAARFFGVVVRAVSQVIFTHAASFFGVNVRIQHLQQAVAVPVKHHCRHIYAAANNIGARGFSAARNEGFVANFAVVHVHFEVAENKSVVRSCQELRRALHRCGIAFIRAQR